MSNYPDGTSSRDPKAPWNEPEAKEVKFEMSSKCKTISFEMVAFMDEFSGLSFEISDINVTKVMRKVLDQNVIAEIYSKTTMEG